MKPVQRMAPSPRELEVLAVYARTGSQEQTAAELGLSLQTVKNHVSSVIHATGSTSSIGAMFALGWIVPNRDLRVSAIRVELERLRDSLRDTLIDVEEALA